MKKIDFKKLVFFIVITFLIGSFFTLWTDNSFYSKLNKPFDIPAIVFPIVWSILFLLMGISIYIIDSKKYETNVDDEVSIYFIQLIFNSLWTLFFFGYRLYLFSFIWLLILLILVIIMVYKFYKVNKGAAFLNIPYILWLLFAGYLNYMIYYLN